MRCERGSVFVGLPAGSLFVTNDGGNRAYFGMDIHRVAAEVVSLLDGEIVKLGRVQMLRDKLEEFARKELTHDDHVVIEATRNAAASLKCFRPTWIAS